MKELLLAYSSTLVSMLAMDALWLGTMMERFYKPRLGELLAKNVSYGPAIVFYLLYAVGAVLLIISPALKNGSPLWQVFAHGALLGAVAYGTYDLTNQATLKSWPVSLTIVDLLWGSLLTGTISVVAVLFTRWF